MPFPVLSTYRLQMRGDAFTFADAEALLPYLDDLGVSHLYLSPILTATTGSTHGYDVTDPTSVSAELGGAEGLASLSTAARSRGMGVIVDIVPNHVGVGDPQQNAWWWDVLTHGRDSAYSSYFDIDWTLADGRIVLPVLGSDDDVDDLVVDGDVLRLGDLAYPVAPGTGSGTGREVHDRQHYTLIGWRHGVCGYRRFFSITSLAGLRQEDRAVFDATHVEVKRWFDEGSGRRGPHRPSGRPGRPGRLPGLAARDHRAAGVDRHREDPRGRRAARPEPARGGHDRIRRTARDRWFVRRSRGRGTAHRPGRLHRRSTTTRCRDWRAR